MKSKRKMSSDALIDLAVNEAIDHLIAICTAVIESCRTGRSTINARKEGRKLADRYLDRLQAIFMTDLYERFAPLKNKGIKKAAIGSKKRVIKGTLPRHH